MDLLSKITIVDADMVHFEELESTSLGKTEDANIA